MFGVVLASYAVNAMDRQIFPLVASDVRREYGFALASAGLLSTIFTLGMAMAGVPTGYLLARFSRKTVVQAGIGVFSVGTALTAVSSGFADMLAYRAATGVGEAMQLTAVLAIAASYFSRWRAAAAGSVNFAFGLGAIAGPAWGGRLVAGYGSWRAPLVAFGVVGLVAMVMVALCVRPWLSEAVAATDERSIVAGGARSLANRNTVLLTAISLLGGLIIYGYLGMYPAFLREQIHLTPAVAGGVLSMYGLGALASIPGGWLGDRWPPQIVLGASLAASAVLAWPLFSGMGGVQGQAALSLAWGIIVSGVLYVNLAGYHVKAVESRLANQASGLFVTSLYGSASVAGYLMGWLAGRAGWLAAAEWQIMSAGIIGALLTLGLRSREAQVSA